MPKSPLAVVTREGIAFPAKRCVECGGTVLIGAEKFHDCPGARERRYTVTVADGTRGMERGR